MIDIIILIFLILGFLLGFKRGMISSFISLVGMICIVILSFSLKNFLSVFLYEHLPFFHFFGLLNGISILNILFYEGIAFLILFSLFFILFKIILKVSKILDKILKLTIVFTIPSKIIGGILGLLESYLIIFMVLFLLNLPVFHTNVIQSSKLKKEILYNTPYLSDKIQNYNDVTTEFIELKKSFKNNFNDEKFHLETIDLFLKYHIISKESLKKLIKEDKIEINGVDKVLEKYEI